MSVRVGLVETLTEKSGTNSIQLEGFQAPSYRGLIVP